jgi:uncharacterized membrane protein YGL010W
MNEPGRLLRTAFMGIWIVPECQVRILSLDYQEYLFRLFHENRLNRISHYIGIPMALATLYAALPGAPAIGVAAAVSALHIAIAARYRLWTMCGVAVAAQAGFVAFAAFVLVPFYANHTGAWASPWLHIFGWSFLQYATHALESTVPAPWGRRSMTPRDEWLRQPGFRHLLLAAATSIPHVFVEWFSGPRNLFLILLRFAQFFGYRPAVWSKMNENLTRLHGNNEPVLRHDRFVEKMQVL